MYDLRWTGQHPIKLTTPTWTGLAPRKDQTALSNGANPHYVRSKMNWTAPDKTHDPNVNWTGASQGSNLINSSLSNGANLQGVENISPPPIWSVWLGCAGSITFRWGLKLIFTGYGPLMSTSKPWIWASNSTGKWSNQHTPVTQIGGGGRN